MNDTIIDMLGSKSTTHKDKVHTVDADLSTEPDESEDTRCDFYFCAPSWCQRFRTRPIMIACLSMCIFTKSMLMTGFLKGNLTSLERHYGLTSKESSIIIVFYNIGVIVCLLPVSHYGGRMRRLRVFSGGVFIVSLGAFLFTLPHFLGGPYRYMTTKRQPVCHRGNNTSLGDLCDIYGRQYDDHQRSYRFVFWLSGLIIGVGISPLHVLCASYIDDNTKPTLSPIYLGIFYGSSILGPVFGYFLSSFLLQKIYVDLSLPHPGLTIADKNTWVGAWWIGPQIAAIGCILLIPVMFSLPKEMPGTAKIDARIRSEAFVHTEGLSRTISTSEFRENIYLLMKNPTFLFLSLAIMSFDFITSGMSTFGPKYMETIFGYTPGEAVQIFGISIVFLGVGGTITGGVIVYYFKMNLVRTLRFMAILSLIMPPLIVFTFLVPCGPSKKVIGWAGLTTPYQNGSTEFGLNASCNSDCQCSDSYLLFSPICGTNGRTYFSPCYAGCSADSKNLNKYFNCSCILPHLHEGDSLYYHRGACTRQCMNSFLFIVLFCVSGLHLFTMSVPSLLATLRTVPRKQKVLALGCQWLIIRVFGSVTGPLLTGFAFDYTCNYWSKSCEDRGNCYLYDQTRLQMVLVCIFGISQTFMSIFLFLAWNFYKSDSAEDGKFSKTLYAKTAMITFTGTVDSFNADE